MKKLRLKALEFGARELLSREQLRTVFGGSDGSDEGSDDESGGSDVCYQSKTDACTDKKLGDSCCYSWDATHIDGKCQSFAPSYILFCSDIY